MAIHFGEADAAADALERALRMYRSGQLGLRDAATEADMDEFEFLGTARAGPEPQVHPTPPAALEPFIRPRP